MTGTDNNYLRIRNIQNELILELNLCGMLPAIDTLFIFGLVKRSKLYFDCIIPDDYTSISGRQDGRAKKYGAKEEDVNFIEFLKNDEIYYNFTKTLLETRNYQKKPSYKYYIKDVKISNRTEDWCYDDVPPELYLPKAKSLTNEQLVEKLISESKRQYNASTFTNNAILSQLETLNVNVNKVILSILQNSSRNRP